MPKLFVELSLIEMYKDLFFDYYVIVIRNSSLYYNVSLKTIIAKYKIYKNLGGSHQIPMLEKEIGSCNPFIDEKIRQVFVTPDECLTGENK